MTDFAVRFGVPIPFLLLAGVLSVGLVGEVRGQQLELVRDINSSPVADPSAKPESLVSFGGRFYFSADAQDGRGRELYSCADNGAPGSTRLVADLDPGAPSSNPRSLVATSRSLFFLARDGFHGEELWVSDGSTAGTRLLKDIQPGFGNGPRQELVAVGDTVYFAADAPGSGVELWKSDGTTAGTVLVADLVAGHVAGHPGSLTAFGSRLVFAAAGPLGLELWISDGTAAGTVLVKDIAPGAADSSPQGLKVIGNSIYFCADVPGIGRELWRSDGTAAGTTLVADIMPGSVGSHPSGFQELGTTGTLLFQATDHRGAELWRSDGTVAGTALLRDIDPGMEAGQPRSSRPVVLTQLGGLVLFQVDGYLGPVLWRSDGTPAGTYDLPAVHPVLHTGGAVALGNRLVFAGQGPGGQDQDLWFTDGTRQGTALVKDIHPGSPSSAIRGLTLGSGGRAAFAADDGVAGSELWVTDGTVAGTHLVDNLAQRPAGHNQGSNPRDFIQAFGSTFFVANQDELWRSDGTAAGTTMVRKFATLYGPCDCPEELTRVGDRLFFRIGSKLWKSDGTEVGTVEVRDITPGSTGGWPGDFTAMGGKLYFAARDYAVGRELWTSDGTRAGTRVVQDLAPGLPDSRPGNLVAVGGTLYFTADDGVQGEELFRSDGTAAGTVLVRDINLGVASSKPTGLAWFRGKLYFGATTTGQGAEPWTSDGTGVGTVSLGDFTPGGFGTEPSGFTPVGDLLFFTGLTYAAGWKKDLWRTDGTAAGTLRLGPIEVEHLVALGDLALILTSSEVYRSAGTPATTERIWAFDAEPEVVRPLASGSRYLWFAGREGDSGTELWRTDGTTAGTRRVQDLNPAIPGSEPRQLTLVKGRVLLSADDGRRGRELWSFDPEASSRTVGHGCAGDSRVHQIRADDPILGQTMTLTGQGATPGLGMWLVVGDGPVVRPLGGGCEAFMAAGTELVVALPAPASSSWNYRAALPAPPLFLGVTAVVQVVQMPTNGPLGFDLSNGVVLNFGR